MKLAGVDVGGTFTDVIVVDTASRQVRIHKVPSTPDDPSQGLVEGLAATGPDAREVDFLAHGTTIATNSLLQHDGARVGMITTRGFRDILHIARHQRPLHYSIQMEVPWQDRALIRRRYRKVVTERMGPRGEVITPLDEQEVAAAARELREAGVESIVIGFINSYRNPEHEERARSIVEEVAPEAFVTTSASLFPQFREYERFTSAAINGFVGLKVRRYLRRLVERMRETGMHAELRLMRSNGGVATAEFAARYPATLLLSGPAAGVLAGAHVGRACGRHHLITFDMGGTSADIGIVTERGIVEATARDTFVAGYPVLIPMIDVHSVGAGGGSVAYVDAGGAFRVGPRSAGARPGPACYGLGGSEPTVTDANLVLGRLRADHFLGGEMAVEPALAHRAVEELGARLGLSALDAAAGIVTLVDHHMANAIRSRTIQKGHDPRRFTLVAFGGAGPLHAAAVARLLGVPEVIVPVYPGITSAMGLLSSDLKYDLIQNEFMLDTEADLDRLNADFDRLDAEARAQLRRDGVPEESVHLLHAADCRYVGQGYELRVPMPEGRLSAEGIRRLREAFNRLHREEYGHAFPDNPIELVNVRVVATGRLPRMPEVPAPTGGGLASALVDRAGVHFAHNGRLEAHPTALYERMQLPVGTRLEGPAVLLQADSTVVVPPAATAEVLPSGDLLILV
ncbi:MAG TPA: hydantoinase/oxoprolinase family protein [Candidatus Dormibacteraeota bacterium]|nr:hydantoinase/oxoprolinase family protein [Candidatus Dormibacteraeota bacterium]